MSVGGVSGAGGGHIPQLPPQITKDIENVKTALSQLTHEHGQGREPHAGLYHDALDATATLIKALENNHTPVGKDLSIVADLLFVVLETGANGKFTAADMLSSFEEGLKDVALAKTHPTKKKELALLVINAKVAIKSAHDVNHTLDGIKSSGQNLSQSLNAASKSAKVLTTYLQDFTNDLNIIAPHSLTSLKSKVDSLNTEVKNDSTTLNQAKTDATSFKKTIEKVQSEAIKWPGKINDAITDLNAFNSSIEHTPLHAKLEPAINQTLNHLNTSLDYAYISLNSLKAIIKQLDNIISGKEKQNQTN